MSDKLAPIGPDDPKLREYVADLGTMFAWLEKLIIHCLELSNTMATMLTPPVPPCDGMEGGLERHPLGPLLSAFQRRSQAPELVQALRQLNQDRISIIHRTRSIAEHDGVEVSTDYEGIEEERVRFRELLERLMRAGHDVRLTERELLRTYHETLVGRFGPEHEGSKRTKQVLDHMDEVIDRLGGTITQRPQTEREPS